MPKKFYAVRVGRNPGIYETWDACRAETSGYPGAIFKGFPTRAEAENYLAGNSETGPTEMTFDGPTAYVDGSYDGKTGRFACGAVMLLNGKEIFFSKAFDDPALAEMHNVAGEIKGAETVIEYCLEQGIPAVTIYHDYQGIASWATGEWKTNKPGTAAYAAFCWEAGKKLRIRFVKVKGHSGDKYNDLADCLAKEALGIGKKKDEERADE